MRSQRHSLGALVLLGLLQIPSTALGQDCPNPPNPAPGIPYCSYYERFPYGIASYNTADTLNGNFNDYGSLFQDMSRSGCCPETVQRLLFQKIEDQLNHSNTPNSGFNKAWLGGGDIYLIATTALQLGARGALPAGLDAKVLQAINTYVTTNTPLFKMCGGTLNRGDTCMDDYSVGAAGFAWAAAYVHLTGRETNVQTYADRAKQHIADSFSQSESVCLHRVGTPCDKCETITDVVSLQSLISKDEIEVVVFNRGDNPNYGVGLFTSLSTALEGLRAAGKPYSSMDTLIATIAQGLFRHGQKRVSSPGGPTCQAWGNQCYKFGASCSDRQSCIDAGYKPGMYPVKDFLKNTYSLPGMEPLPLIMKDPASPQFQFEKFCCDKFQAKENFFGDGRLTAYRDLAWRWPYGGFRPALAGPQLTPADVSNPMVWVDAPGDMQVINDPTDFSGWAIDRESAIVAVTFELDSGSGLAPITLEGYNYGGSRNDVCAYFGLSKCPYCPSGWGGRFDPSSLQNGTYRLRVSARDVSGKTSTFDRYFVVNRPPPQFPPTDCAHSECEQGPTLTPSCSSCANLICTNDAFCCNTWWDGGCVSQAKYWCGYPCW